MNQDSSVNLTNSPAVDADAISRRAYEIWEREGRPEGNDLRHWLQAEQELRGQATSAIQPQSSSTAPRNTGTDTRPLQGTRAAGAAGRESKRGSTSPFGAEKPASATSTAARRKPGNAPVL